VRKTLNGTVVEVFLRLMRENHIPFEFNKSELILRFLTPKGPCEVLFYGLDDPEKIKSIKGITGEWLEEATEFTEEEFLQLDLRLREPGPLYHQIMLSFNPDEVRAPWLKKMFFGATPNPDALVHRSTIEDNPIAEVREEYGRRLEKLREQDPTYYTIYRLGEWAAREGRIFNWDVCALPDLGFDDIFCGGDFGYSIDPAAVVRVYRRADEYWVEEVLYKTGLTNQALAVDMSAAGVGLRDFVYFDSAEPKSIAELRAVGFNVQPAEKGPDSVRVGLDFLKSLRIHIVQGSENLLREHNSYCWRKDRATGKFLPEPVEFDDHLMDATRYAIFTHCWRRPAGAGRSFKVVYV
jgi:phage terminase large subunit